MMQMEERPTHHFESELLLDYASGAMPEPQALVVATHLALCPRCRGEAARLESLGGVLLEELEPEPVSSAIRDALLARLDDEEVVEPYPGRAFSGTREDIVFEGVAVPVPLRDYLSRSRAEQRMLWERHGRNLESLELSTSRNDFKTRLLRIKAGAAMPRHGHGGAEWTLVLAGGFTDSSGHYLRGDIAVVGPETDHSPRADEGVDCVCLAVISGTLRLTGPLGRLINPFLRF